MELTNSEAVTHVRAHITVHPEAVPDDASELRWVTGPGYFEFVGEVTAVPASLQHLVDSGVLTEIRVEPSAVIIRLSDGRVWRREGECVRVALTTALADTRGWVPAHAGGHDDVVRMVVHDVIAGDVGDYIRSHGGEVELVAVCDGNVEVRMGGACAHCPMFEFTLVNRFEAAVRARCPRLGHVTSKSSSSNIAAAAFHRWGFSPRR